VDFGRLGLLWIRKAGEAAGLGDVDCVGLFSTQLFVPLFNQQLSDVIQGLESTWAFLGGIPKYLCWIISRQLSPVLTHLIPDYLAAFLNMPSAVISLPTRQDPGIQRQT